MSTNSESKSIGWSDWIVSIVCPYCGSDVADWVDSKDACFSCPDCGEVDCV